jgi:hypothetical protein
VESEVRLCRIEWWRGYFSSTFFVGLDDGSVLESKPFRWRQASPPPESIAGAAYAELLTRLAADGWRPHESSGDWYATTFVKAAVAVTPEASDAPVAAEPPAVVPSTAPTRPQPEPARQRATASPAPAPPRPKRRRTPASRAIARDGPGGAATAVLGGGEKRHRVLVVRVSILVGALAGLLLAAAYAWRPPSSTRLQDAVVPGLALKTAAEASVPKPITIYVAPAPAPRVRDQARARPVALKRDDHRQVHRRAATLVSKPVGPASPVLIAPVVHAVVGRPVVPKPASPVLNAPVVHAVVGHPVVPKPVPAVPANGPAVRPAAVVAPSLLPAVGSSAGSSRPTGGRPLTPPPAPKPAAVGGPQAVGSAGAPSTPPAEVPSSPPRSSAAAEAAGNDHPAAAPQVSAAGQGTTTTSPPTTTATRTATSTTTTTTTTTTTSPPPRPPPSTTTATTTAASTTPTPTTTTPATTSSGGSTSPPPPKAQGDDNVAFSNSTPQCVNVACFDLLAAVPGLGPGNSLAAKVNALLADLTNSDTAAACGDLRAAVNEVNAQTGKKITAAQAASFIAQAQKIEATLGC